MNYTITVNPSFSSTEVSFDGKPSEAIRDALKAMKFRWHGVKKVWYGYKDADAVKTAIENAEGGKSENKPAAQKADAVKVNRFGVKVGDLFETSWGYEQTNVDFFQVVALVGDSSVRVREVCPVCEEENAVGPMAADRTYNTNTEGKLLPARSFSVFIKDQEKGDLKRLKSYAKDGKSDPLFTLSSFASARLCKSRTSKVYESWYY